jgi:hypothetical protein
MTTATLYNDGLNRVGKPIRAFKADGAAFAVWSGNTCLRGYPTSDAAIEGARELTKAALLSDPAAVRLLSDEPAAGYGRSLKRVVNAARKAQGMPALASRRATPSTSSLRSSHGVVAAPERKTRTKSSLQPFDRRGFIVIQNDGVFEYWQFTPKVRSTDHKPGRNGARAKPMHSHRIGDIVLTIDNEPVRDADGALRVFGYEVHAEEAANELIEAMPEDEVMRIDAMGRVYEDIDGYVVLFRKHYPMTPAEFREDATTPYLYPYTIWKRDRSGGLSPLSVRRSRADEELVIRDPEVMGKKTVIQSDERHTVDVKSPVRAGSLAGAITAIEEIKAGRRLHGYLAFTLEPMW